MSVTSPCILHSHYCTFTQLDDTFVLSDICVLKPLALQGGSGRDGLDGLPGKPGMKVIKTSAHNFTCIIEI